MTTLNFAAVLMEGEDAHPRRFRGVCYSGGLIPGHGGFGDVAIDLASLKLPTKELFTLVNHDYNQRAGKCRITNDGQQVLVEGEFLDTPSGQAVAAEFAQGAPWEFSVGIGGQLERFPKARSLSLNGQTLTVQTLFRQAQVREVSFVPAGADPHTQAIAFAATLESTEEFSMTDELTGKLEAATAAKTTLEAALTEANDTIADLTAQLKTATEALTTAQAQTETAQAELSSLRHALRETEIKALFERLGREYVPEVDTAYFALSDDAFRLFRNELTRLAQRPVDPRLFEEQTISGQDASSPNGQLESAVAQLMTQNPNLTRDMAVAQALRHNPSLYATL